MRYLSICSGIEAASVAWEPLGFTAAGFSEIDPFASAVLAEPEWIEASQMHGRMWASPASWPASEPPAMGTEGREQACPEMSAELAWVIGRWLGERLLAHMPEVQP